MERFCCPEKQTGIHNKSSVACRFLPVWASTQERTIPIALRKAKIACNFDLPECKRVKPEIFFFLKFKVLNVPQSHGIAP